MTIRPQSLNFITSNANKLAEVRAILGDVIQLSSRSLELVEIQGSIEEIAVDKARRAAEAVSGEFFLRFAVAAACFSF
jgi:inosine triphosphate pyrophosphatase